jgi:replicative DNA helicase
MNYKEIGEQIYKNCINFIESRISGWGIKLNDEEYLERLTYQLVEEARKYKSPMVSVAAKNKLREYLHKYTSYRIDQEEIINTYYLKAQEKIKLDRASEIIKGLNIKDISLLEHNINELQKIKGFIMGGEVEIHDGAEVLKDNLVNGFNIKCVPTRIDSIDKIMKGFRNEELTTIAARPGVGKTAMMCQCVSNISKYDNVGVFSCEMNKKLIMNRITACETGIDSEKLAMIDEKNYGFLSNQEKEMLCTKADSISKRTIKIVDTPNIHIDKLCEKALEMVKDYKVAVIMIDYLQLITCDVKENRAEQLSHITKRLKGLARETGIPIIELAQLNRNAEGKRPSMAELKGSGAIEEDSDMIIFLHGIDEKENDDMLVEIIVEKNRNGKTGFTKLLHQKPISRFTKNYL